MCSLSVLFAEACEADGMFGLCRVHKSKMGASLTKCWFIAAATVKTLCTLQCLT